MGCKVFANGDGFFHKGSGGTGKAFPDVCLSPPPAPTGPVPVPYPNSLTAADLTSGSKTVKIEGNETALEDSSNISTSTGDEAGNQGGSVITHKTKGKGYFMMWSFDIKVEGKGVDRHEDPIGQNCASKPISGLTPKSQVALDSAYEPDDPCSEAYVAKKHRHSMVKKQYDEAERLGKKSGCWQCGCKDPRGWKVPPGPKGKPKGVNFAPWKGKKGKEPKFVPDHQPPSFVIWYTGGCEDEDQFKIDFQDKKAIKAHCKQCSDKQGGFSAISQQLKLVHGHGPR